ncbi:hypothetical protein [Streptosporangium sp. CA-115845]|uniref:hypothetical protein n=1 Tax=Streptosporangium sp. CA-115845 TaxID=3240071 RepID=UPI003D947657
MSAGKGSDVASGRRSEAHAVAGPGGVMTDEVGVITGELLVSTEVSGDRLQVRVQYAGAEEWYTLTGSPFSLGERTARSARAALLRAVRHGLPEGLPGGKLP